MNMQFSREFYRIINFGCRFNVLVIKKKPFLILKAVGWLGLGKQNISSVKFNEGITIFKALNSW